MNHILSAIKGITSDSWGNYSNIMPRSGPKLDDRIAVPVEAISFSVRNSPSLMGQGVEVVRSDSFLNATSLGAIINEWWHKEAIPICNNCNLTSKRYNFEDLSSFLAGTSSGTFVLSAPIFERFSAFTLAQVSEMFGSYSYIENNRRRRIDFSRESESQLLGLELILWSGAAPLTEFSRQELSRQVAKYLPSIGVLKIGLVEGDRVVVSNLISNGYFCNACEINTPVDLSSMALEGRNANDLSLSTLTELYSFIKTVGAKEIEVELQVLFDHLFGLGFAEYCINHSSEYLSRGEQLRLKIVNFLASDLAEVDLELGLLTDIFSTEEWKNYFDYLKSVVGESRLRCSKRASLSELRLSKARLPEIKKLLITVENMNLTDGSTVSVVFPKKGITGLQGRTGSGKSLLLGSLALLRSSVFRKVVHIQDRISSADFLVSAIGIHKNIARVFAAQYEARSSGFKESDFDIQKSKFRCSECKGRGYLNEVKEESCPKCGGQRFEQSLLRVAYQGVAMNELMTLNLEEVGVLFAQDREIVTAVSASCDFGLAQLEIGSSIKQLAASERLRINLVKHLSSAPRSDCLILLDEPFVGLDVQTIEFMAGFLSRLTESGNAVVLSSNAGWLSQIAHYMIGLDLVKTSRDLKRQIVVRSEGFTEI